MSLGFAVALSDRQAGCRALATHIQEKKSLKINAVHFLNINIVKQYSYLRVRIPKGR